MSLERNKGQRLLSPESAEKIIPPEIFDDEILPRLPGKNLQSTLKLVCKDWLNLISGPGFIRRQLLLGSNRSVRILVPQINGIINIDYKKQECVSSKEKEVLIPFPPEIYPGASFDTDMPRILGFCDGLIILANKYPKEPNLTVFNPSTGKSELFTNPPKQCKYSNYIQKITCSWFGHHPTTGEYVLVLCERTYMGLLTFRRENKLIAVQSCSVRPHPSKHKYNCHEERGIFLDGVVYWQAQWTDDSAGGGIVNTHTISGYRIQDNKHFEISPPRQTYFKLGVLDGCLMSIHKRKEDGVFEVWVMKETSVWTKYRDIEGVCNTKFELLSPLTFFPNGDLIMEGDACILTRYDFNHNKATFLNRYHPPTCGDSLRSKAIVCADSLVSPTIVMEEAEL